MTSETKPVAHFHSIAQAIIGYLEQADEVYVCSCWVSHPLILEALSQNDTTLLMSHTPRVDPHHPEYDRIFCQYLRDITSVHMYPDPYQLVHHKYVVLLKDHKPYAVITGSYNLTYAADANIENMVYLPFPDLARAYTENFRTLLALSPKLNFE